MLPLIEKCSVHGCNSPVYERGLCVKHYFRLKRRGHTDPNSLVRKMCPVCYRWFEPSRADQIFDTHACREAWYEKRKRNPELPERPNTHPNVTRMDDPGRKHIRVVPFTRSQVYEKCHGLCAVCREPVDRSVPVGMPESAVYAWSVPPRKCGYATLENRVVVHLKCLKRLKRSKR